MGPIRRQIQCASDAVHAALQEVMGELAVRGLPPDDLGTVEIVLAELLNNISEHAYPAGDPDGAIRLNLTLSESDLLVETEDFGRALPEGVIPPARMPDLDVAPEAMPEGGFGWAMIASLASDIGYNRIRARNRFSLRIPISGRR